MSDIRKHMNLINESAGPETYNDGSPEIGTKFTYNGQTFACVGWMTELRVPGQFGKRGGKLIACPFDKATWVLGMGGGGKGTLAPIPAIQIVGQMGWSEEQRDKVVQSAMMTISKKLTLDKPRTSGPKV